MQCPTAAPPKTTERGGKQCLPCTRLGEKWKLQEMFLSYRMQSQEHRLWFIQGCLQCWTSTHTQKNGNIKHWGVWTEVERFWPGLRQGCAIFKKPHHHLFRAWEMKSLSRCSVLGLAPVPWQKDQAVVGWAWPAAEPPHCSHSGMGNEQEGEKREKGCVLIKDSAEWCWVSLLSQSCPFGASSAVLHSSGCSAGAQPHLRLPYKHKLCISFFLFRTRACIHCLP